MDGVRWAGREREFAQPFSPSKRSDTLGCTGKFCTSIVLSGVSYTVPGVSWNLSQERYRNTNEIFVSGMHTM